MKPATWLTPEEAAAHLGIKHEDGTPNVRAFNTWKWRMAKRGTPVPTYRIGPQSLRYRQVDLDRLVEPQSSVTDLEGAARHLRAVGGRR